MKYFNIKLLLCLILSACTNTAIEKNTESDDNTILKIQYYPQDLIEYEIKSDTLYVVEKLEMIGKKDSIVFSQKLDNDAIRFLQSLNFEKLNEEYINPCINDGLRLGMLLNQNGVENNIYIENMYLEVVDSILKIVNSSIPNHYKLIKYNKEFLLQLEEVCNN